jgi:hypothetical protein
MKHRTIETWDQFRADGAEYLPNGAQLIDLEYNTETGEGVVLASGLHGKREWITWRFFHGDLHTTTWGHYYTEKPEAFREYAARVQDRVLGGAA